MRTKLGRFLLSATAGVGLASVSFLNAYAAEPVLAPNCPYPIVPAPGAPGVMTPLPGTTTTPAPGTTTQTPDATRGAIPGATPAPLGDSNAGVSIPADAGFSTATTGGDATGPSTGGTTADMLGRSDFMNRFNIFDTQSAIPKNRVWFNFQRNENFNPSITRSADSLAVTERPTTYLYRMGGEVAFSERASLSFQHQYIGMSDTTVYDPSWGDPQFLLKYALSLDCDRAVSATLGFSPHFATSEGEIRSPRARIYPGLLVYQAQGDAFIQAGTQLGIPLANGDITTFDYALSAGYWVYKAPDCDSCSRALLTGIAPQVELFGQHAFWDNRIDGAPLGFGGDTLQQGRHVLDVTVGASVFLRNMVLGAGYSFPITGAEARRSEIIGSVQFRF